MQKTPSKFRFLSFTEEPFECECCGSCFPERKEVYVDNKLVWRHYSDGHMGGDCTEDSLVNCVIKEWNDICIEYIENFYTEPERNIWNEKHPGNGIARTPEAWSEQKNEILQFQKESYINILDNCSNLPYNELIQLKMIALWVESDTEEKIEVVEDNG